MSSRFSGSEWRHWTALTARRFRRCWEEKTTRSNRINFRLTVIQSWNFADFDLYICGGTGKLRNLGFRQCKTMIIPLIPISQSSVSCCRRCLRCANRCSFCSAVSCWRFLLCCSRWIWSPRSRSRGLRWKIFLGEHLEPPVVLVCDTIRRMRLVEKPSLRGYWARCTCWKLTGTTVCA